MKNINNFKSKRNVLLICLCDRCLSDFKTTREYRIKRSNIFQYEKDICTFCNTRRGFDYLIESFNTVRSKNRIIEENEKNG